MDISALKELVSGGKIFSVVFTKRTDGSERKMVARTGVHKGLKGTGERQFDPEDKGLLQVYDVQKQGYRMIPAEGVHEVRVRKKTYKF